MSKLVPTDDIAALAEGCYEQFVVSIDRLVSEHVAAIFGAPVATETLATFADYAIVAAEDGRFAKVDFAKSNEGMLTVVGVAPVEIRSYAKDDLAEFVQAEADGIVDRLFAGQIAEAQSRLLSLAPLVTKKTLPVKSEERAWRKTFAEKNEMIRATVSEEIEKLGHTALAPKFGRLSDGSIPVAQHEGYRELVRSDLGSLSKRLAGMRQTVEQATAAVAGVELDDADEAQLVDLFRQFSKDLLSDLTDTARKVGAAVEANEAVASLAAVYDGIARDLLNQEVAGAFVASLAAKLCESNE